MRTCAPVSVYQCGWSLSSVQVGGSGLGSIRLAGTSRRLRDFERAGLEIRSWACAHCTWAVRLVPVPYYSLILFEGVGPSGTLLDQGIGGGGLSKSHHGIFPTPCCRSPLTSPPSPSSEGPAGGRGGGQQGHLATLFQGPLPSFLACSMKFFHQTSPSLIFYVSLTLVILLSPT